MIGTRYITKDRKPLQTLLPLESPLVLFIDVNDSCCLKCTFCPSSNTELMHDVKRPLQAMSFILYKKIIDDLYQFKTPIKVARLYSHGEPLLNKNFCEMVKYAKASHRVETVDVTTNGILLNENLNLKLIESGIDRINISVNGINAEQYKSFTGHALDFDRYVSNIKHLYANRKDTYIFIKICGDTISKEDSQKFLEIFEPIADAVAIEHALECWSGFKSEGFVNKDDSIGIYGQEIKESVLVCPYSQYTISIGSDGKVSSCFLDWSRKLIIGDVNNTSVYDIWHGSKVNNFQEMMLEGKRKDHFYCKDCAQLRGGLPSDIDMYAGEILKIRDVNI